MSAVSSGNGSLSILLSAPHSRIQNSKSKFTTVDTANSRFPILRMMLPLCHDSICSQKFYILTQHTSKEIVAHARSNIARHRRLLRGHFYICDCHCCCGIIPFAFKGLTSMDLIDFHLPLLLLSSHTRFSLITIRPNARPKRNTCTRTVGKVGITCTQNLSTGKRKQFRHVV